MAYNTFKMELWAKALWTLMVHLLAIDSISSYNKWLLDLWDLLFFFLLLEVSQLLFGVAYASIEFIVHVLLVFRDRFQIGMKGNSKFWSLLSMKISMWAHGVKNLFFDHPSHHNVVAHFSLCWMRIIEISLPWSLLIYIFSHFIIGWKVIYLIAFWRSPSTFLKSFLSMVRLTFLVEVFLMKT